MERRHVTFGALVQESLTLIQVRHPEEECPCGTASCRPPGFDSELWGVFNPHETVLQLVAQFAQLPMRDPGSLKSLPRRRRPPGMP